jgi:hypothetical protein
MSRVIKPGAPHRKRSRGAVRIVRRRRARICTVCGVKHTRPQREAS